MSQDLERQALIQHKFDLAIWLSLANWPALTLAVQNQWGGADSDDKRDWLAGAISDHFATNADTDAFDVEDILLQVLQDEFDVNLEDGSEVEVAQKIYLLRQKTAEGRFGLVDDMYEKWQEQGGAEVKGLVVTHEGGDDEDADDEDDDMKDGEADVNMEEAPALAPHKEKPKPEVDEDGFTKVMGKRR